MLNPGSFQVAADGLASDTGRFLNAGEGPAQAAERADLYLFLVVQDVAHAADRTRVRRPRQRLDRRQLIAGFGCPPRFHVDVDRRDCDLVVGGLATLHALFDALSDNNDCRLSEELTTRIKWSLIADFVEALCSLTYDNGTVFMELSTAIGGAELEYEAAVEASLRMLTSNHVVEWLRQMEMLRRTLIRAA